jgi:hypothetical protein
MLTGTLTQGTHCQDGHINGPYCTDTEYEHDPPQPPKKQRDRTIEEQRQRDLSRCKQYITAIGSIPRGISNSNLTDFLRLLIQCDHPDLRTTRGSLQGFLQ